MPRGIRIHRAIAERPFALIVFAALCLAGIKSGRAEDLRANGARPLGTVSGVGITEDEVKRAAAADLEKLELQRAQYATTYARSRHQILQNKLDSLIEQRLIAAEALRLSISEKELLSSAVDSKVRKPSEQEVVAFYESNKARIKAPIDQVRDKIRVYLSQQSAASARAAFVAELKKRYPVETNLKPLRYQVNGSEHSSAGPAAAPVTIVEFSDFECAYCRSAAATLKDIQKHYPSEVRLVFRNYPLGGIHPHAQKAAEAALCAGDQDKFWEMHDALFEDQKNLKVDTLKARAAGLGLDAAAFNSCLDSGRHAKSVDRDVREATLLGLTGTPALFINGRLLSGSQPFQEISRVVDEELKESLESSLKAQGRSISSAPLKAEIR